MDWRSLALGNLAALSQGKAASGEKVDESGEPFVQVLLHEDAMGPSRLLLPRLFEPTFGTDYAVAVPEQTCAVIYRNKLSPSQAADVQGMIMGCFELGTEPMSADRFRPEDFWGLAERLRFDLP